MGRTRWVAHGPGPPPDTMYGGGVVGGGDAQSGRTGLIQAANTAQMDVVRLLLEKRADVNAADKVGVSVRKSPEKRSPSGKRAQSLKGVWPIDFAHHLRDQPGPIPPNLPQLGSQQVLSNPARPIQPASGPPSSPLTAHSSRTVPPGRQPRAYPDQERHARAPRPVAPRPDHPSGPSHLAGFIPARLGPTSHPTLPIPIRSWH